jgi:hypothetical protein
MKQFLIISSVFVAIAAVSSAQIPNLTLQAKKGTILQAWIEPESPNNSTVVTLHVSIADLLQVDHVEVRRTTNMYIVKIYWDDPADSNSNSNGDSPIYHEESLGILSPGAYIVSVVSFYKGRMVDIKQMSFRVVEAPSPWAAENIDNVWIDPENPTTLDAVTLHVSGKWPTSGFSLYRMVTMAYQRNVKLYMYWSSPNNAAATVVTPYEYGYVLQHVLSGTYTVRVESYLDGKLVDWEDTSFDVTTGL